MALNVPFSPLIHLLCLSRNSFMFQLHFPLSHLDDLIIGTSNHKYMACIELPGTPYTANKDPGDSRVKGKTPGIEDSVLVAAKTELACLRGKSYWGLRLCLAPKDTSEGVSELHHINESAHCINEGVRVLRFAALEYTGWKTLVQVFHQCNQNLIIPVQGLIQCKISHAAASMCLLSLYGSLSFKSEGQLKQGEDCTF